MLAKMQRKTRFEALGSREADRPDATFVGSVGWIWGPVQHDARMLNSLHDGGLGGTSLVRLCRADSEVCEQRWLPIYSVAIKVLANQIGRCLVRWEKDVVSSNVPNREEAVTPIQDGAAMNFAAGFGASARQGASTQNQFKNNCTSHGSFTRRNRCKNSTRA